MSKYRIGKAEKMTNTYEEYIDGQVEGYIINENATQIDKIEDTDIQKWLRDPEDNIVNIVNYMTYMYITDGYIYQLYTMFKILPKLNYKIKVFDKNIQSFEDNLIACEKALYQVKYKTLTRDIIGQLLPTGSIVCTWLGNKKAPYLYIFDNNEYIFSSYRRNGEWVAVIDLDWVDNMEEAEKERMYETFKEIKLKSAYEKYLNSKDSLDKYLELPQERTHVIKINTVMRNQRIGLPMGTQSLYDINHKKVLRDLETNIIDKIIKSIAVLTIGDENNPYDKIGSKMKSKIISSVKNAIAKAVSASGVPVTVLPPYANLNFPEIDGTDVFKDGADKFSEVNNSTRFALGLSEEGSNYQSSKLNLDIVQAKIGVILEEIQIVYQKLFAIILSKKIAENLAFEFITGTPLTNKEEVEILQKLHAEGSSYKNIVDMLSSVTYTEFINDAVREIDDMGLREIIYPPKTSSTLSSEDSENVGNPTNENPESEETIKSQESGGNLVEGGTE